MGRGTRAASQVCSPHEHGLSSLDAGRNSRGYRLAEDCGGGDLRHVGRSVGHAAHWSG